MVFKFVHANINVSDLERSIHFYEEALGMKVARRNQPEHGRFEMAYLCDEKASEFMLELTWLKDKEGPYDLGDNESHLCFQTDDYHAAHEKHKKMGCICFENDTMGLYFIEDPDEYWIEIVPNRR